ncbi:single-stranded DNA-binding protein [Alkalibacterium thalassium]|uniref:Single-stranded DNA-binding protein n=1 Tax=Alkalibacterium thalassium TaxID=426701 RepID=A0A1G8VQP7_9LACT|nr:single-stranded DNA-binding protein [Alkalibacterium thalassium]SDJ68438.1 single-strand binding protein [Alkalibacterium thalassium]
MINNVVLVGRLTRDADLRYTRSGSAVASFTVAVERPFTNAQGERETDFVSCVVWKKPAENLANFTRKGSMVAVAGRIQTRNYTGNDGKKVFVTEVVAENIQYLDSKKTNESRSDSSEGNHSQSNQNSSQGKNNGYQRQDEDPFEKNDSIDISDDDLPFD